MLSPFNELIDLQSKQGRTSPRRSGGTTRARNKMMLVTMLAIFGALGLGFVLTLSLQAPLRLTPCGSGDR